MFKLQNNIALGLDSLIESTRKYTDSFPFRLAAMQKIYLEKNRGSYDTEHQKALDYCLSAFSYKFYLATLHLEQLWAIAHGRGIDLTLHQVLLDSYDTHDTSDDDKLLSVFSIEGFVIQGAAFYDFFGLYLWSFFNLEYPKRFRFSERMLVESLEEIQIQGLQIKVTSVLEYYGRRDEKIWRKFIKTLRHSMVHRDELRPSFEEGDTLVDKLLQGFPSHIENTTCARFCQDMQNDMFFLVTELVSTLYDLEWKPGLYIAE